MGSVRFLGKKKALFHTFLVSMVVLLVGFTVEGVKYVDETVRIQQEQFEAKPYLPVIFITSSYDETILFPEREKYEVVKRYVPAARVNVDTVPARSFAYDLVADDEQFNCLEQLWNRESGWNHLAVNRSSGAYGIPQAYPAEKLAAAGDDWRTNPETQIRWGLSYIDGRYGSPCNAWGFFQRNNWY